MARELQLSCSSICVNPTFLTIFSVLPTLDMPTTSSMTVQGSY